jgi:L-rhamnose mutarotase
MQKFCLALDLKNEPAAIVAYEKYHENVWLPVIESIKNAGITSMEIYRIENRLCMVIEATDDFSFFKKAEADNNNPFVQEWENLMNQFQQPLTSAKDGEKWVLMQKIFDLKKYV